MCAKRLYRRILIMILIVTIIMTVNGIYNYYNYKIPNTINVKISTNEVYELNIPATAKVVSDNSKIDVKNNNLKINTETVGNYNVDVKLFGLINFKSINVNVIKNMKVTPCGYPIGIYLETDGVMIIGTGEVKGINGEINSPADSKVQSGDYIQFLNGIPVDSKSQLIFLINKYGSSELVFGIKRNNKNINVKIKPAEIAPNEYKAGIWVRDDTQGIGTLTYITDDGTFGALGHGISDIDTGRILNSNTGKIYEANIWGIKKGTSGNPGGLCGVVDYENDKVLGNIKSNTNVGIFGDSNSRLLKEMQCEKLELGLKQDIHEGPASIRCYIDGEIREYSVEVISIDKNTDSSNKNMIIQVTDTDLLRKTNGIVQGLSGSPIIQDNKLIGAVTHVFVNDPTKGYAIFIENMIVNN